MSIIILEACSLQTDPTAPCSFQSPTEQQTAEQYKGRLQCSHALRTGPGMSTHSSKLQNIHTSSQLKGLSQSGSDLLTGEHRLKPEDLNPGRNKARFLRKHMLSP